MRRKRNYFYTALTHSIRNHLLIIVFGLSAPGFRQLRGHGGGIPRNGAHAIAQVHVARCSPRCSTGRQKRPFLRRLPRTFMDGQSHALPNRRASDCCTKNDCGPHADGRFIGQHSGRGPASVERHRQALQGGSGRRRPRRAVANECRRPRPGSGCRSAGMDRGRIARLGGEHGFPSDAWTNARLRELTERRFGVHYSRVYAWQIATNLGSGHRLSKSSR